MLSPQLFAEKQRHRYFERFKSIMCSPHATQLTVKSIMCSPHATQLTDKSTKLSLCSYLFEQLKKYRVLWSCVCVYRKENEKAITIL